MKILEIKNNLVKLSYDVEEALALGSFIALEEASRSYVGQIMNLKADIKSNYAVAKLIFTFTPDGIVDNYDGTIPSMQATLSRLTAKDILRLLPIETPVALGEIAQQNQVLNVDQTIFEKNLVVCAEKFENVNIFVKNAVNQLQQLNEKAVVIDVDHTFGEFEPIRFKRDFKLPLNARMIDFIYENDLSEVDATSKAIIQDIFYEVQEYTKTVEDNFIPFETFLSVVADQYEKLQIPELALLKNKLLKYQEANVFAQTKDDLNGLREAVEKYSVTYIDVADATDELQRELIAYTHDVLDSLDGYAYLFVKLNNKNADKKLLKQVVENEHIFTNIICSHAYRYLVELKQRAENVIFFAPQTVQHDFASYNTFLTKLNSDEFVVYGNLTQNVPFIVELTDFSEEPLPQEEPPVEDVSMENAPTIPQSEVLLNNDIEKALTEEFEESVQIPETEAIDTVEEFNAPIFEVHEEIIEEEPLIEEVFIEEPVVDDVQEEPIIIEPEISEREELIEQVARDVDEVFYTNKTEDIPSIDEVAVPSEEELTEDDLDFIEELPQQVYEEPQTDEPEIIEEEPVFELQEEGESLEVINEEPVIEEEYAEKPNLIQEEPPQDVLEEEPQEFEMEPEIPVYPAEQPVLAEDVPLFEQGDTVSHPKYGRGVIEKLIKYGNKTLCSISFENVGRRLLDPAISELEKI